MKPEETCGRCTQMEVHAGKLRLDTIAPRLLLKKLFLAGLGSTFYNFIHSPIGYCHRCRRNIYGIKDDPVFHPSIVRHYEKCEGK
jgi:hypothetical protein